MGVKASYAVGLKSGMGLPMLHEMSIQRHTVSSHQCVLFIVWISAA
jgi:hypothetical protein